MKKLLAWIMLCGSSLALEAQAGVIYKCRQAGGVVSYQDKPCPGRQIGWIRTSAPPAPAKAVSRSSPAGPNASAATPTSADTRARPANTGRAPRPSFRCVRPDATVYFSGDARPKRTLVDASTAPATRLPVSGAPAAPPGKLWVQDQCLAATRSDTCQYYTDQIAANDARQSAAKGDYLRRFTREGQRLRTIRNHRCG